MGESNEKKADNKRAVAFWRKQCDAGYGDVLRAFDCSGLGMFWLQNVSKMLKSDCNAHGLYGKCKKLKKADLRVGDFVFKINSTGRATHIGYVADTDINVIEALGRDAGVVKRPLSKGNWNGFGRPPFWTEEEVQEIEGKPEPEPTPVDPDEFVFRRTLKYCAAYLSGVFRRIQYERHRCALERRWSAYKKRRRKIYQHSD